MGKIAQYHYTLEIVSLVLHNQPHAGLHHFGGAISDFLGPDPNLTLSEACAFSSTDLLQWLLSVSAASVSSRSSLWNVGNYLRTESEYSTWQFCGCMEVVASRNDLKLLRWFFRHLKGFHVPVEAVEIAAERGHLEFLQFLLAHDLGRECTRKCTSKATCDCQCVHECIPQVPEHLRPKGNWVHWAGRSIGLAVDNGHSDVAKWLHEHAPHQSADCEVESIVRKALAAGDIELAEYFRPEGTSLLDFAPFCPRLEVIEMMLQSGMLRRNQEYAARAIADLAQAGRLDLIQQLAMHFNQPLVYRGFDWSGSWYSAIKEACLRGDLAMVQWLVEHRKGRQFCRVKMKKDSKHMHFLCYAAGAGSVDVMQFLYDKQYADQFVPALLSAVCKNQLAAVKWLLDHLPAEEQSAASCVIEAAASHGRLEILQHLAKLDAASSWWSPSETAMSLSSAAAANFPDVVQWLVANHSNREGSSTAMDKAAGNGHLDMVKWLHAHGFKCSVAAMDGAAMDGAAANGHLEMVRWLHENSSAGCTTHAMDLAAGRGHLDVLKWLHRNRSEGCTKKAMTNAVEQGHVAS